MSLAFPASPTVGQIYQGWTWNGSAWDPNYAANFVTSINAKSGALQFADVTGPGNLVLLSRQTVSTPVASITFTSCFTAAYRDYELWMSGVLASAAVNTINYRFSSDGGVTFPITATYYDGVQYAMSTSPGQGLVGHNGVGSAALTVGFDSTAGMGADVVAKFFHPRSTTIYKNGIVDSVTQSAAAGLVKTHGFHSLQSLPAVDSIQLLLASGNFTAGVFSMYGKV